MVEWDESVLGMLAPRGTRDEELTGIISALSIVQKNEKGTVLTALETRMLDTLVYSGLAPIWSFVESRGRALVHRAYKGAQYRKSQPPLAYDLWVAFSPIGFRTLDRDPLFGTSIEQAIAQNREYFRDQALISEAKRARLLGPPKPKQVSPSGENVPERAGPQQCVCDRCGWT